MSADLFKFPRDLPPAKLQRRGSSASREEMKKDGKKEDAKREEKKKDTEMAEEKGEEEGGLVEKEKRRKRKGGVEEEDEEEDEEKEERSKASQKGSQKASQKAEKGRKKDRVLSPPVVESLPLSQSLPSSSSFQPAQTFDPSSPPRVKEEDPSVHDSARRSRRLRRTKSSPNSPFASLPSSFFSPPLLHLPTPCPSSPWQLLTLFHADTSITLADLLRAQLVTVGMRLEFLGREGFVTRDGWIEFGLSKFSDVKSFCLQVWKSSSSSSSSLPSAGDP